MSDFAGFAAHEFAVGEATIFARVGGSGSLTPIGSVTVPGAVGGEGIVAP